MSPSSGGQPAGLDPHLRVRVGLQNRSQHPPASTGVWAGDGNGVHDDWAFHAHVGNEPAGRAVPHGQCPQGGTEAAGRRHCPERDRQRAHPGTGLAGRRGGCEGVEGRLQSGTPPASRSSTASTLSTCWFSACRVKSRPAKFMRRFKPLWTACPGRGTAGPGKESRPQSLLLCRRVWRRSPPQALRRTQLPGERKAGHAAGHAKPSGTHRTPTYAPENGTKKLANTSAEDGSNSTDTGSTKKGGTDVTVADPVPKSDSHTGPGTDKVCSTGPDAVCVPPGAAGAKNGNWQKQGADTESTKLGTERLKGKVKAARKKEQGDEQSTKVHACALCGATSKKDPAVRLKACGRCNLVMYCGKKCQSEDWPSHKRECKSVKVAEK
eukprot:jgi/Botrbrau1/10008/Bobra.0012s0096.1